MDKDTIKELLEHPEFTLGEPDDKAIQSTFKGNIIPFEPTVYFGENEQFERQVKPGEYFATKIYRKGIDDYAFAYINIDDWNNKYNQDINAVINDTDVTAIGYVDGGEYGVAFGERLGEEHFNHPENYHFHDTNCGDGGFVMFENKDSSVFIFDDMEIICGQPLFFELHDINYNDTYIELYKNGDVYTYTFYDEDDNETKMVANHDNRSIKEALTDTMNTLFAQASLQNTALFDALDDLKETDFQR